MNNHIILPKKPLETFFLTKPTKLKKYSIWIVLNSVPTFERCFDVDVVALAQDTANYLSMALMENFVLKKSLSDIRDAFMTNHTRL